MEVKIKKRNIFHNSAQRLKLFDGEPLSTSYLLLLKYSAQFVRAVTRKNASTLTRKTLVFLLD